MQNIIADDELYATFKEKMPESSDKEIALMVADFLEQVPPKDPLSEEEELSIKKWIKDLREYATIKGKIETLIENCNK